MLLNTKLKQSSLNKSGEVALQTLLQTKKNIEFMLADADDLSLRILSNDKIQRFLSEDSANNVEYDRQYSAITEWMNDVIGMKDYYDGITISRDGSILFQRSLYETVVDPEYERIAVYLKGTRIWSHSAIRQPDKPDGNELSFYRNIVDFNKYGHSLGVLKISIKEEAIEDTGSTVNSYRGEQRLLIDEEGNVLSANTKTLIGQNYARNSYIQRALAGGQGHFVTDVRGVPSMVLYFTVEPTGWRFIQTIPVSAITGPNRTNTVLVMAIALCMLFGILFSFVQHRYLIQPLLRLLREMSKLKRGNFDIALHTESTDEIGEINRAFYKMSQELKETINTVYISKIRQREAELTALEAQINPHFLYNTLDSIRWLAMKSRNYEVSDQIEALSEIFKHVLNKGQPLVTIGHELEFLNNYMLIQEAKYGNRIRLVIHAPAEVSGYKCPKLILQPLVENALVHGLDGKQADGLIEVTVERKPFGIQYTVTDNGAGTDAEAINRMLASKEQSHHVFALKNIDDRIKLHCGEPYGLAFFSSRPLGTRVEVRLPLIEETNREEERA